MTDPRYALTDTLLADLARERSARIAAEEARDKWKSCYQTQETYLEKIEATLTAAEAELAECQSGFDEAVEKIVRLEEENARLSQALSYERDEYAQYREAHPWATHALSSDEHNCRCGAPWPCAQAQ